MGAALHRSCTCSHAARGPTDIEFWLLLTQVTWPKNFVRPALQPTSLHTHCPVAYGSWSDDREAVGAVSALPGFQSLPCTGAVHGHESQVRH